MMYRSRNKYKIVSPDQQDICSILNLKGLVARSTRKCKYGINGLMYDLKLYCIEETNFFQIVKNVMNLFCFKEFFRC